MPPILFDIIIVAVLALFFWWGWRKGFLLSLCGLAVVIVAFVGAGVLADALEQPVTGIIQPRLEEAVRSQIALHYDDLDLAAPLDSVRDLGGLFSDAADALEGGLDAAAGQLTEELASRTAEAVSARIARAVVFALCFILLIVALTLLLHALDLVAKLPGLKFCNKLGGGAVGLVKGVIVLFAAVFVLRVFTDFLSPETVERTWILKYLFQFDPLTFFIGR